MSSGGNKSDSETLLRNHGFWRWEYQRRNEQYIKDYDIYNEFIKVNKETGIKQSLDFGQIYFPVHVDRSYRNITQKFLSSHGRLPKDYRMPKITPGQILDDIHNNCFTPEIDDLGDLKIFEIMENNFSTKLIERPFNLEDNPKIKLEMEIDTSSEISRIIEKIKCEVSYWYHYSKAWKSPETILFDSETEDLTSTNLLENYRNAFFEMIREHHKKKDARLRYSNTARASGLWLYDYKNKHKCEFKDAVKALIKHSENIEGSKISTDAHRLKKRYEITEECIEESDVLKME